MYNPLYVDLGLTKDMVGAVRGSVGLVGVFLGVARGRLSFAAAGTDARGDDRMRAARCSAPRSMRSCLMPMIPLTFAAIMVLDNFGIALAGVTLVAYMSSLTSLGYTATQYALLSSTYAWAGKLLKGFSGAAVEGLAAHFGLMNAYAVFFLGCGASGSSRLASVLVSDAPSGRAKRGIGWETIAPGTSKLVCAAPCPKANQHRLSQFIARPQVPALDYNSVAERAYSLNSTGAPEGLVLVNIYEAGPFEGRLEQWPVLAVSGALEVRLAETDHEVEQAQRLRYTVFYEEMSAIPSPQMREAGPRLRQI